MLALASALVLLVTGVGWATLRTASGDLITSDVLAGGPRQADGATDILLVGVDSRTDAQGRPLPPEVLHELRAGPEDGVLNTDTIILVRIANDGSGVYAISIPRDSYVDIPGYRKDKINAAYPAVKALTAENLSEHGVTDSAALEAESAAAGRRALRGAVERLTGLQVDHYAEINLLGFYNLTNAIGGVDVCLRDPVDDQFSGAHFPSGVQTVSGGDALAFVRQRHGLPNGDLDRIRRQQVFLAAVARKVLSAGTLTNPSRLRALLDAVTQSVVLDSGWDILGFAQQMQGVAAGSIEFVTIPTHGIQDNDRGSVVLVDPTEVRQFVHDLVADHGRPVPTPQETPQEPPTATTVDVHNSSRVSGLAAGVADLLAAAGYPRGVVDNAPSRATSTVRYPAGEEPAAHRVADTLGGLPTEPDPAVPPGTLQVFLGTDYYGPTGPRGRGGLAAPGDGAAGEPGGSVPPPPPQPPITAGGVPCVN